MPSRGGSCPWIRPRDRGAAPRRRSRGRMGEADEPVHRLQMHRQGSDVFLSRPKHSTKPCVMLVTVADRRSVRVISSDVGHANPGDDDQGQTWRAK
jgi:hypothetical protein